MGDVDDFQAAEEAAAQRAQDKDAKARAKRRDELRAEPLRPTARITREPRMLALEQVHPGDNIRLDLPDIQELALSIREVGLLTPLLVRPWAETDGPEPSDVDQDLPQYRLIAGHRRHAALLAIVEAEVEGYDEVACEIRDGLSEAEAYALMLTENVQRVPLEPIQAARALRLLLDLNEGLDAASLARSLGLRPAWAQVHLKLLDLPQEVQDRIEAGDLSVTIADMLRRGQSTGRIDEKKLVDLAAKVASGEITSAQVKAEAGPPPKPNTAEPRTVSMTEAELEREGLDQSNQWERLGPVEIDPATGEPIPGSRPATPLSNLAAADRAVGGPALASGPIMMDGPLGAAGADTPFEEQLDAYLLGRALREWADDAYLEDLEIDRVQTEAWAAALSFEERIGAIRQFSWTLLQRERSLSPA